MAVVKRILITVELLFLFIAIAGVVCATPGLSNITGGDPCRGTGVLLALAGAVGYLVRPYDVRSVLVRLLVASGILIGGTLITEALTRIFVRQQDQDTVYLFAVSIIFLRRLLFRSKINWGQYKAG